MGDFHSIFSSYSRTRTEERLRYVVSCIFISHVVVDVASGLAKVPLDGLRSSKVK